MSFSFSGGKPITYASHGLTSAARRGGRLLRGPLPATQPVNEFLHSMREEWDSLTTAQRVERVRQELLFIADPVAQLDEDDHYTFADLTLGELYHARLVLVRLLPHLISAAAAG